MTDTASPIWGRRAAALGMALLIALMLLDLDTFAATAIAAIRYPFEFDYGEGIVWQQMDNIVAGTGYAPLGVFPAIVYHYPPIYHLVTASVAAIGGLDPLAAGRVVSVVSVIGCAAAIARWAWLAMPTGQPRTARLIAAGLAGLSFVGGPTILFWSTVMRVDMLACFLTLAGMLLAIEGVGRPSRLPWAALLFALAVYTKQTAVAAPAVAFVVLWLARPRSAWTFLLLCGGLGVAALGALTVLTDGEFLTHVLTYNLNRLDLGRWHLLLGAIIAQTISTALAVGVAIAAWRQLRPFDWRGLRARIANEPAAAALATALLYFAFRTVTLPMGLKSGANVNYLIDWFSVVAVLVGLAIVRVAAAIETGRGWPSAVVTGLVLIGLPVQAYRLPPAHEKAADAKTTAQLTALVARIEAEPRPVIADEMMLLRRAGRPVLYEPAIAAELGHAGRYDEAAFAKLVRRGYFGFFITSGGPGDKIFDERYNPAVADAIAQAYPVIERYGDLTLRLPARH